MRLRTGGSCCKATILGRRRKTDRIIPVLVFLNSSLASKHHQAFAYVLRQGNNCGERQSIVLVVSVVVAKFSTNVASNHTAIEEAVGRGDFQNALGRGMLVARAFKSHIAYSSARLKVYVRQAFQVIP